MTWVAGSLPGSLDDATHELRGANQARPLRGSSLNSWRRSLHIGRDGECKVTPAPEDADAKFLQKGEFRRRCQGWKQQRSPGSSEHQPRAPNPMFLRHTVDQRLEGAQKHDLGEHITRRRIEKPSPVAEADRNRMLVEDGADANAAAL
jgi:hypothetical protein